MQFNKSTKNNFSFKDMCYSELIGKYTHGYGLSIMLHSKTNSDTHTIFERFELSDKSLPIKTTSNHTISDRYQMEINIRQMSLSEINNRYEKISSLLELEGNNLTELQKTYMPQSKIKKHYLTLCNESDDRFGGYIFEFFNNKNAFSMGSLSHDELSTLAEIMLSEFKELPLNMPDRFGNIIFYLPCNLLKLTPINAEVGSKEYSFELRYVGSSFKKKHYVVCLTKTFDEACHYIESKVMIKSRQDFVFEGLAKDEINQLCIYDVQNQIINYMESFESLKILPNVATSSHNSDIRSIQLTNDDNKLEKIDVQVSTPHLISDSSKEHAWKNIVSERQERIKIKELEESMDLMQFYGMNEDRVSALNGIRSIIGSKMNRWIYMWDPYLNFNDILNTIYFSKNHGNILKVITSSNAFKKKDKDELIDEFIKNSNHLGINLEVRCQKDKKGGAFHDRFIITISQYGELSAWSLGTSINSIGKSHHIIQKVSNPYYILSAFNKYWDYLDDYVILRIENGRILLPHC